MAPVPPYGSAIRDALSRKETTVQELEALRDYAKMIAKAQGDLRGALERLDAEIARRQRS